MTPPWLQTASSVPRGTTVLSSWHNAVGNIRKVKVVIFWEGMGLGDV